MANFCPKCGGKVNPDDKFCKSCGTNVAEAVEVPPAPMQAPVVPQKKRRGSVFARILGGIFGAIIGLLIVIWVLYSIGCATGKYPNTEDQMCKQIYQFFQTSGGGGSSDDGGGGGGGGGGTPVSIGCQHCSKGYCWTGQACCPSSAQYYCKGHCYRTSGDAYNAGCHQSTWTRWCCY